MPVAIQCPTCGKKLRAPDAAAGKKVRCPCGAKLVVPAAVPEVAEDRGLTLDRLADGAPMATGPACPECRAALPPGAVLCTQCGFLLSGGKQLATNLDDAPNPPEYQPPRDGARMPRAAAKSPKRGRDPDAAPFNWKALVLVVILLGVGIAGYRWIQILRNFDPEKYAQEKLATVKPGMALAQVVTNLGEPQEVYRFGTGEGHDKDLGFGPLKAHWSQTFLNDYKGRLTSGFYLVYRFSAGGAWEVHFDANGIMQSVDEAPNLLKG